MKGYPTKKKMKSLKAIVVLYGGFGEEREVSLKSGEKVINSLKLKYSVEAQSNAR